MKTQLLWIFLLLNLSFPCYSQNFNWASSETVATWSESLDLSTHDKYGNTFIGGNYVDGSGNSGIYIVKFDKNGKELWKKNYPESGGGLTSLCVDSIGNLYSDLFASPFEGVKYNSSKGVLFVKYDPNGNLLWVNQLKCRLCLSKNTDKNNNVIATGSFVDTIQLDNGMVFISPPNQFRFFLAKFNTNGHCVWAQPNDGADHPLVCNSKGEMFGVSAEVPPTVGQGNKTVPLNAGSGLGYCVKYDASGSLVWVHQILSTLIACDEYGNSYIFVHDSANYKVARIAKYDPSGNMIWERTRIAFGGYYSNSINCGANGDLYFAGGFSSFLQVDTTIISANGGTRSFVIKMDSAGTVKWVSVSSGSGGSGAKDINFANGNEIYISGDIWGSNTFGAYSTSQPQGGAFAVKLTDGLMPSFVTNFTISNEDQLTVYPNPSNRLFNICYQTNTPSDFHLIATDVNGKVIYSETQEKFSGNYTKLLDLNHQPDGIYFIEVISSGQRRTKRIVLQ